MLRENGGKLVKAVLCGDWRMAEVLLDLLLPPLGYYVLLAVLCCVIPHSFCRILGAVGLISVAWHVITCVLCGNSIQQDLKTLASVPVYIGWKLLQIPLIVTTSFKRAAWIRTTRPLEAE